MSRKDTILIAILVNVGVLTILFMTSIKHPTLVINSGGEISIETKNSNPIAPKQALDQVDLVLSQYEEKKKNMEIAPPVEIAKKEPELVIPATTFAFEQKTEPKKDNAPSVAYEDLPPVDWITIEIKSGDVLEKIAKNHGCSVEEIKRVNHLSSPHLYIGQTIYVPKTSIKAVSSPQNEPQEAKYYVVKQGDNPWTIAMKNQLKIEELLRLNNLDESKAKKLKPGDRLRIK